MSLRLSWGDVFEIELRNYLSRDGQMEFDLVGNKNKVTHIFEVKWRNKPSTYKDVERFLDKVKNPEFPKKSRRLFFISKAGFTEGALNFSRENQITVSDGNDLVDISIYLNNERL